MLNIGNGHLSALDPQRVKKQRRLLQVLSLLLLVAGLFCLFSPFASGAALSAVMGIFLLLSGIGMIVGMIVNRAQNTWPMIGSILLGIAYLIIGYVFITRPAVGIFTMAVYLAALFALGGVFRLLAGYQLRAIPGSWIHYVIGVLDLAIAWMLLSADAATSVILVTTIVGIEMLFSAFGLFMVTRRVR